MSIRLYTIFRLAALLAPERVLRASYETGRRGCESGCKELKPVVVGRIDPDGGVVRRRISSYSARRPMDRPTFLLVGRERLLLCRTRQNGFQFVQPAP